MQPTGEKLPPPQYQQPQAHPGMGMHPAGGVGFHPAPQGCVGGEAGREWSTGLCACKDDCGGFCLACWCPCITNSEVKQRLDSLKEQGRPLPKEQIETCGSAGLIYLAVQCVTGCGFILDFMARDELRKRYNISEGSCGAFCKTCCCVPCAQRQHHRELLLEEGQAGQWGAAPQPGQAMV